MSFPGTDTADSEISIHWVVSCLAGHTIDSSLWAVGPFSYAMLTHTHTHAAQLLPLLPCHSCCFYPQALFWPLWIAASRQAYWSLRSKGSSTQFKFPPPRPHPPLPPGPTPHLGHGDRGQPSQYQCFAGKTGHHPCSDAACRLDASIPCMA